MILDPLGDLLADAGSTGENILRASLDKRFLDNYRERFPVSNDWDRFDLKD
jgi:predicted amidohydrolase